MSKDSKEPKLTKIKKPRKRKLVDDDDDPASRLRRKRRKIETGGMHNYDWDRLKQF